MKKANERRMSNNVMMRKFEIALAYIKIFSNYLPFFNIECCNVPKLSLANTIHVDGDIADFPIISHHSVVVVADVQYRCCHDEKSLEITYQYINCIQLTYHIANI